MENPENIGLAALVIALLTAWFKIRPAMRKIEVDEDASLRSDLMRRITHLEESIKEEHKNHTNVILEIRREHDNIVRGMQVRHDAICKDYELKLAQFQERVDKLMDQLLERKQ